VFLERLVSLRIKAEIKVSQRFTRNRVQLDFHNLVNIMSSIAPSHGRLGVAGLNLSNLVAVVQRSIAGAGPPYEDTKIRLCMAFWQQLSDKVERIAENAKGQPNWHPLKLDYAATLTPEDRNCPYSGFAEYVTYNIVMPYEILRVRANSLTEMDKDFVRSALALALGFPKGNEFHKNIRDALFDEIQVLGSEGADDASVKAANKLLTLLNAAFDSVVREFGLHKDDLVHKPNQGFSSPTPSVVPVSERRVLDDDMPLPPPSELPSVPGSWMQISRACAKAWGTSSALPPISNQSHGIVHVFIHFIAKPQSSLKFANVRATHFRHDQVCIETRDGPYVIICSKDAFVSQRQTDGSMIVYNDSLAETHFPLATVAVPPGFRYCIDSADERHRRDGDGWVELITSYANLLINNRLFRMEQDDTHIIIVNDSPLVSGD
jgi:hypothetical protein